MVVQRTQRLYLSVHETVSSQEKKNIQNKISHLYHDLKILIEGSL